MKRLTPKQVCDLARAFEGVTEKDHFGSDAFSANGRIFVTVWHDKNIANLMLNREQQRPFLSRDGGEGFRTLENSWGEHAFSAVLSELEPTLFREALQAAWENSRNKRKPLGGGKKKGGAGKPRLRKETDSSPKKGRKKARKKLPKAFRFDFISLKGTPPA